MSLPTRDLGRRGSPPGPGVRAPFRRQLSRWRALPSIRARPWSVLPRLRELPLARCHDGTQLARDLGHLLLDQLEVVRAHRDRPDRRRDPDGRHPTLEPQERDLADHVPRSDRPHGLAVLRDLGRTFLDHEHLVGDGALFEQHLSFGGLHLPDVVRDRGEVVMVQLAEESKPSESFDVHRYTEILLRGRNVPCPSFPWNSPFSTRTFPRCITISGSPFTVRPS